MNIFKMYILILIFCYSIYLCTPRLALIFSQIVQREGIITSIEPRTMATSRRTRIVSLTRSNSPSSHFFTFSVSFLMISDSPGLPSFSAIAWYSSTLLNSVSSFSLPWFNSTHSSYASLPPKHYPIVSLISSGSPRSLKSKSFI